MKRRPFIAALASLPFAVSVKPKTTEKPMQLIHGDSTWATMPKPEVRYIVCTINGVVRKLPVV